VWLNEYRIWTANDPHARAYRTLQNEDSKAMARKLGLASATTAKICLDCHADNIAEDKRGPKFQITDGVGCEACHGGSELWIESHAEPGATHADNLAKGMYPTEEPLARAGICLSCHMGTRDQFATHRIMGAGHPRLAFELEAFTANQPAHYEVDEDYIARKRDISGFTLWLTGQLESAERFLELIGSELFEPPGLLPELSFYDCHSCHHPMDDVRWTQAQAGPGVEPGSLRLQDQHLRVLKVVASVLDPDRASTLAAMSAELVRAGQTGTLQTRQVAARLLEWVADAQNQWTQAGYGREQARAVRAALVAEAARGRMADYSDAEQVFFAAESLSVYLGDADARSGELDVLFDAVASDEDYDPEVFRRAAGRVEGALQ